MKSLLIERPGARKTVEVLAWSMTDVGMLLTLLEPLHEVLSIDLRSWAKVPYSDDLDVQRLSFDVIIVLPHIQFFQHP